MALTGGAGPNGRRGGNYSAAERAAVIIAVLGEEAARPIVEKLDDVALAKVSSALSDISRLSRDELSEIVVEFLGVLRGSPVGLAGRQAQARDLVAQIYDTRRTGSGAEEAPESAIGVGQAGPAADVWRRLALKPSELTGQYLSKLSPSLIALVIRKLGPAKSSEVLCHVDEARLQPVMAEMVEAAAEDPGIESIIARMINIEFLTADEHPDEDDAEHLGSIGEILSLIPASKRDKLVEFLKNHHAGKLAGIQKSLFTIEGLPDMLPRAAVPLAFRDMDAQTTVRLIASLQGAYSGVAEFLLSNLSARLAAQIREDLKEAAPVPEHEADILQRDFLSSLMTMKRAGTISLT